MGLVSGGGAPGAAFGSLPAGSEAGQVVEWNGSLWVVKRQTLGWWTDGAQNIAALADQFFGPSTAGTSGQGTEAAAGAWLVPYDCVIDRFFARHVNSALGSANPITWIIHVNGANSTLQIAGNNTNAAGPFSDLVNTVNLNAGDRFCIRATWPTALLQGIRPAWGFRARSRNVSA